MQVCIEAGMGCLILDTIENDHRPLVLRANETHLILTKVRLKATFLSAHGRESSSDDLFTELQNELGDNWCHYITARVSYKHSGFCRNELSDTKLSSVIKQATQMQTEATAVIRRHNPKSAWLPRNSQVLDVPLQANPIIRLIEAHFHPKEAREAIKKISESKPQIRPARRLLRSDSSVEEITNSTLPMRLKPNRENIPYSLSTKCEPKISQKSTDELDPARKIWTEIRRNSRGNHTRKSLNTTCFRSSNQKENNYYPGEKSYCTGLTLSSSTAVGQERGRILELALRNKRSLGTDTLRSIAPSIVEGSSQKPKDVSGTELELEAGGNWLVGLFSRL